MARDLDPDPPVFDFSVPLDLALANAIAEGRLRPVFGAAATARCRAAEARLERVIAERRHVYGLTTGYGPLADRLVAPADAMALQQNLVHHLATGTGAPFDWATGRAVVLARLASIARGMSGASTRTIAALLAVLGSDLAPAIPERGTVGASGDLTPLAHMVLCLQGRGAFLDRCGTVVPPDAALARIGMAPLDLGGRDGLALVNGTSAMTALALRSAQTSRRLVLWALALTAALAEVLGGRSEAWHPAFAELRPHEGQRLAASVLRARLGGSRRVVEVPIAARRLDTAPERPPEGIAQDAYTLRCAPQVIGAVLDSLAWHDRLVETELNSVTDNPIFPETGEAPALHGGNFMGQHVGLASDALANALRVLAGLAERQMARLTDERLNGGLPAFLHRGRAGLNSGFMGAQVSATALVAEMRSVGAASPQSISTNGANQDVVSMGTIAARHARDASNRAAEVVAILSLAVAQAIELCRDAGTDGFSPAAEALRRRVRGISPALVTDRPLATDIADMAHHILETEAPA
ncbi:HAL/PAL/TAL family ammonia-lyase [Roseivivax isoporae]|uniref:Histidine ammonia-lyase n=1 Tax=Roseivivax isoporae LMG 25204 TaxID=1449351 RepID=X7F9G0_9RHOB|nr:aromatic amino acid ammonia-lyase [Roseivivax isoporae]ETX29363.1 histidine ammonia-lyase [Roseivivax isoporae LMG 25204]